MDLQNLNLGEAAKLCGVSVQTVRRRKDRLEEVGATTSPTGWKITLDQLIAVGLTTKVRSGAAETSLEELQHQLEEAQARAREAELRAEKAEAIAAERERIITTQAQALRLLEAPRDDSPPPAPPNVEPATLQKPPTEQKRGFFRRIFG